MEGDRLSAKMQDTAIWTLKNKTTFRLFQKIWNHLTAGSKRTSRPISGNFRTLSRCRAEQIQVKTVEQLDRMFLIGCYFPVMFFFGFEMMSLESISHLISAGLVDSSSIVRGSELRFWVKLQLTLKSRRRVKVQLESCNLSRVGGREDTPQEAARPG